MIPCATLHLLDGTPVSVSPYEVLDVRPALGGCVVTLPGRSFVVRESVDEARTALELAVFASVVGPTTATG